MSEGLSIETIGLRKVYGSRVAGRQFAAVEDLSLAVPRGQVFGFLGPNGAGKTTTINMLLGNVSPTAGSARMLGAPVGDRRTRARIGFLPEKFQFHDFLSAEEFLDLHGRLYGLPSDIRRRRAHEALDRVGLLDRRKSRLREFSKGMQQRVGLAQAILADPEMVILDEPTSALDPLGRRSVRDLIRSLKEKGTTVFLNSHLLSEIEMTCDEVAIIKAGRVVRFGAIDDLLSDRTTVEIRVEAITSAVREAIGSRAKITREEGGFMSASLASGDDVPDLAAAIVAAGGRLRELSPRRDSLEELFIRVVEGEDAR